LEIDPFADENEPETKLYAHVHLVRLPRNRWVDVEHKRGYLPWLYVSVALDGLVHVEEYSQWEGKKVGNIPHNERREIYEYLREWELIALRKIGPDDREWFATKKLSSELGIE